LLVPVTSKEPGANPDNASIAVTVASWTNLWFGGQSVQPPAGIPEITGDFLSMFTLAVAGQRAAPHNVRGQPGRA
jgi:hypothetical protein